MTRDVPPPAPDDGTGRKFRRRAEARPDEILDAALALFAENGFDGDPDGGRRARAGLSKGAVYLYFPSKRALLEGHRAAGRRADRPDAAGAPRPHRGDPRPAIRQALTAPLRRGCPTPASPPSPRSSCARRSPRRRSREMYRAEVLDQAMPVISALIARGIE